VVQGRIVVPNGKHKVSATLGFGFTHGDVGQQTWGRRVTFAGSGEFALVLPGQEVRGTVPRAPYDDAASSCDLNFLASSLPIASPIAFAKPTGARTPFTYSAPADSIQAFGIGAPLGKPTDARTISLYTVWSGRKSAITKAWVPVVAGQQPALQGIKSAQGSCTMITIGIGPDDGEAANQVTVTTRMNCGDLGDDQRPVVDKHEPVAGAPGFAWGRPSYPDDPDIARKTFGAYDVWVQGGANVARDRVAHIAAALTTRRNLAVNA
jgi:hypothetical protein